MNDFWDILNQVPTYIKKYYETVIDIKNKQAGINKFVLNNTVNKKEESKLLSDIFTLFSRHYSQCYR
jgi:hypothetical protein